MRKGYISILLILTLAVCMFVLPASAYNVSPSNQTNSRETLPSISRIVIISPYNSQYSLTINVAAPYLPIDYVGYNHITTGPKVKACQGYSAACGCSPGTIDGIWGPNSDQALRDAQDVLNGVYPAVTSDGVCGPNTWRGFYGYCGGVPYSVRCAVWG